MQNAVEKLNAWRTTDLNAVQEWMVNDMKQCYKCDFCLYASCDEEAVRIHEESCGYNPKNKVKDPTLFRLSMIYNSLQDIIACALYNVAKERLCFLYDENERANSANCFFAIAQSKEKMRGAIYRAKTVTNKHTGRNSSTYKDIEKEYPELLQAMTATLRRKAWNE